MKRLLMKGTEAIAESAIQAGCRYFFGYPITPQNEIPEYMSKRLPEVGGTYLQAESEVSAINMVLGGLAAGGIVMTSSSSPGISLMAEGISYMVGQEITQPDGTDQSFPIQAFKGPPCVPADLFPVILKDSRYRPVD